MDIHELPWNLLLFFTSSTHITSFLRHTAVLQTLRGVQQAEQAGQKIKRAMDSDGQPYNLFFYTSPYKRSRQTHDSVSSCFAADQLKGVQEEVQLREQDFGNFQVSCWALVCCSETTVTS